jgi:hypothetical protein
LFGSGVFLALIKDYFLNPEGHSVPLKTRVIAPFVHVTVGFFFATGAGFFTVALGVGVGDFFTTGAEVGSFGTTTFSTTLSELTPSTTLNADTLTFSPENLLVIGVVKYPIPSRTTP